MPWIIWIYLVGISIRPLVYIVYMPAGYLLFVDLSAIFRWECSLTDHTMWKQITHSVVVNKSQPSAAKIIGICIEPEQITRLPPTWANPNRHRKRPRWIHRRRTSIDSSSRRRSRVVRPAEVAASDCSSMLSKLWAMGFANRQRC